MDTTELTCASCRSWCRPIEGEPRRGLCLARSRAHLVHWDKDPVAEINGPILTFASDSCDRFCAGPPPDVEIQGVAGDLLWILLEKPAV